MFCSKCGNQINQGEKFCSSCGNPIEIIEPTQPKIDIPKPEKTKKQVNKKVIVLIAIIASMIVVGLIALVAYLSATAPEREMKKALETNDYYTVMTTYDSLVVDGDRETANQLLNEYINNATDIFNEEFDFNKYEEIFSENTVDYEIAFDELYFSTLRDFLSNRFGNMFVSEDSAGLLSADIAIVEIEDSIYSFEEMIESKESYYSGVFLCEFFEYYVKHSKCEDVGAVGCAIEEFSRVISEDKKYNDSIAKSEEIYEKGITYLIDIANNYINQGDYSSAMELLEGDWSIDANDEILIEKINSIRKEYAAQYATKAEEEFKNGDINAAIGNIEAAISIYPNGEYEAKLEEYKLYLPLALYNKENFLSYKYGEGGFSYEESVVGNDNKRYNNVIIIDSYVAKDYWNSDASDLAYTCEYNLDGKYDLVSGIMLLAKDNQNQKYNTYFKAYGDGKLLYTSPSLKSGDLPEEISFNVSGIQKLKFEFYIEISQYNYVSTDMYIGDLVAQKSISIETTE